MKSHSETLRSLLHSLSSFPSCFSLVLILSRFFPPFFFFFGGLFVSFFFIWILFWFGWVFLFICLFAVLLYFGDFRSSRRCNCHLRETRCIFKMCYYEREKKAYLIAFHAVLLALRAFQVHNYHRGKLLIVSTKSRLRRFIH